MFVKINSEANINISETYRIWESPYTKNTMCVIAVMELVNLGCYYDLKNK